MTQTQNSQHAGALEARDTHFQAPQIRRLAFYQPHHFVLTLLGWILFSMTPLVLGYLSQQIFDSLSGEATIGLNVWALLVLLLTARTLNQGITLFWLYRQITWEHTMMALLRTNLFATLLNHFGRAKTAATVSAGDAVSRFRDDIEGTSDIVNEWYRLIGHGLFAIVALIIMLRIDPLVTVAATMPLFGIVIVVHRLNERLAAAWQAMRAETSHVTSFLSEIFGSILAVKVAVAEESAAQHFHQLNDRRRYSALRLTLIDNIIGSFNVNIVNIGRGLVLLLAAQAFHAGSFTVGDFALFSLYLFEFLELPRRVGRLLATRKTAAVSSERLLDLMEVKDADLLVEHRDLHLAGNVPPHSPSPHPIPLVQLTVRGLTYQYPTAGRGIANIDLELRAGSVTVITGRVGAGKSTLLRVLLGLLPRDAGEILWNGEAVTDPASFFVPPQVAYTPQVPRLFSETLRNNILLGVENGDDTLDGAIYQAVLAEEITTLEKGIETLVGPRGVRLSGGQRQRAAAARMFARPAELLLFDDLSSALDVETERLLWERLLIRDDTVPTCLIASHSKYLLQRADQIVVLKGGQVEDRGRLDELLVRCHEMQQLWTGETVTE